MAGQSECVLLDIPLPRQRLFGFLLDYVEGLVTHSRAQGSDGLRIWFSGSQRGDFSRFLKAWERFQLTLERGEEAILKTTGESQA